MNESELNYMVSLMVKVVDNLGEWEGLDIAEENELSQLVWEWKQQHDKE